MDTTLYYTLSTISQTLGGTLGLFAFVVFFLQSLKKQLEAALGTLDLYYSNSTETFSFSTIGDVRAGDLKAAMTKVYDARDAGYHASGAAKAYLEAADRLWKRRERLIQKTRDAVCMAVAVISVAVFFLILTSKVSWSPLCWVVVAVVGLGFGAALLKIKDVVAVLWSADN